MDGFSHFDEKGNLSMVDVSAKSLSERIAIAKVEVIFPKSVYEKVKALDLPKGDFVSCAKVAGILGAKKTWELIPLCHPLQISKVDISLEFLDERCSVEVKCLVKCTDKTGVEMEALTGASIAALTIYDMCKALSKEIKITNLRLVYKKGGKSGELTLEKP